MKSIGRSLCVLLFVFSLLGVAMGQMAPGGAPMAGGPGGMGMATPESLQPMTMNDAMLTVTVGDVPQFVTRLDEVAKRINPSNPSDMKSIIGMMAGDPSLAGLPAGSGAALVVFTDGTGVFFAEVAKDMLPKYQAAIAAKGNTKVDVADGMLILSKHDARLATGKTIAAEVKAKLLSGAPAAEIKMTVLMPKVVAKHDTDVQAMLQSMPMMIVSMQNQKTGGQQDFATIQKTARLMEGYGRGMYGLVKQMNSLEIVAKVPPEGIRLETTLRPKPGTDLAVAMGAASSQSPQALLKMLPAKGAIRMTAVYNNAAITNLVVKQATAAMQEMNPPTPPDEQKAVLDFIKNGSTFKGDGAALDMMIPGKPLLSGSAVCPVKDPAAAMKYLENIEQNMTSGPLAQMPHKVKITFAKNVREYKGIPVHQVSIDAITSGMLAADVAALPKLMGSGKLDIAFVGNLFLGTAGGESIDSLIDAVKAKSNPGYKPLVAMTNFAPTEQVYGDVRVGDLLSALVPVAAEAPGANVGQMREMAKDLQGLPPVTFAKEAHADYGRFSLFVPMDVIVGLGKQRQAAQPAPMGAPMMGQPGTPVEKTEPMAPAK